MASERLSSYAARLGFPDSDIMLEILELLFPEGAERAVFEALGKPATLDEIIVKTGLSRQEAEKATSYLYRTELLPLSGTAGQVQIVWGND